MYFFFFFIFPFPPNFDFFFFYIISLCFTALTAIIKSSNIHTRCVEILQPGVKFCLQKLGASSIPSLPLPLSCSISFLSPPPPPYSFCYELEKFNKLKHKFSLFNSIRISFGKSPNWIHIQMIACPLLHCSV